MKLELKKLKRGTPATVWLSYFKFLPVGSLHGAEFNLPVFAALSLIIIITIN